MKILLIHRYFWPDHPNCGQILFYLTKYFSSEGHTIEVLTSLPSKDLKSKEIFAKKNEIFNSLKIKRINLFIEDKSIVKKIINALILGFWTIYFSIRNNFDIIISTSVPPITGGMFAAFAAGITKARFIYFSMDIHPEVGKISKDFSNPVFYKILERIDCWSCSKANPIVVHSLDMKNSLLSRNSGGNFKIKIINNFSIPKEKKEKFKFKPNIILNNKKLTIIFAGNIGRFQSLDTFIDAMILLKNRKDIQLIIVGEGSVKSSLVCKVKKNNANVFFLSYNDISLTKDIISRSDIGLVTLSRNIYKYGYPGKIMTYLEQGKPIIAVLEKVSEIAKLMKREYYGFCVDKLDSKLISQLILKLSTDNSWRIKMSKNAKNAYKKNFSKNVIFKKWNDVLLNL